MNEASVGTAKGVFRPWDDRLNFEATPLVSNEDDPELLIHVPFTGSVKLRAICIIGVPILFESQVLIHFCLAVLLSSKDPVWHPNESGSVALTLLWRECFENLLQEGMGVCRWDGWDSPSRDEGLHQPRRLGFQHRVRLAPAAEVGPARKSARRDRVPHPVSCSLRETEHLSPHCND